MRATRRWLVAAGVAALALVPATPAPAVGTCEANRGIADRLVGPTPVLCVVQDHAHREGAFLVVDAVVRNISGGPVTRSEVTVEFYTYSGDLLGAEATILRPDRLEPGQEGSLLVLTPWQDGIEKLRYLITWRQAGRQYQGAIEHGIPLG